MKRATQKNLNRNMITPYAQNLRNAKTSPKNEGATSPTGSKLVLVRQYKRKRPAEGTPSHPFSLSSYPFPPQSGVLSITVLHNDFVVDVLNRSVPLLPSPLLHFFNPFLLHFPLWFGAAKVKEVDIQQTATTAWQRLYDHDRCTIAAHTYI